MTLQLLFAFVWIGFWSTKILMNGGAGSWEMALHYMHTDLDSKDINSGEQGDITFGTN